MKERGLDRGGLAVPAVALAGLFAGVGGDAFAVGVDVMQDVLQDGIPLVGGGEIAVRAGLYDGAIGGGWGCNRERADDGGFEPLQFRLAVGEGVVLQRSEVDLDRADLALQ